MHVEGTSFLILFFIYSLNDLTLFYNFFFKMNEVVLIVLAYAIGSIPTAVIVGKTFFHIDIRDYGSGNPGATNVFRVLGSKWGMFVMSIDTLKGVVATSLYLLLPYYAYADHELIRTNLMLLLGLAAVIGHVFPMWAHFKGGKGVATLFGMVIAMQPLVAICCVCVFIIVLYLTRFVSLSSIIAGISFMVFIIFIFNEKELFYRLFAILVAIAVIITHRKNIAKLINGKENKIPILKYRDKKKTMQ